MDMPIPTEAPPMAGVVPHLVLSDASAASDFYQRAFGAREVMRIPMQDGKRLMHCHLILNGGSLMLMDGMPEHGSPVLPHQGYSLHLQIDGALDRTWAQAVAAGCEVTMPIELMFWGDRYGALKDPFGVNWALAEVAVDKS